MKETRAAIRLFTGILLSLVLLTGFVYVARVQANRVRWLNRAQNTRIQDARKTTLQGTIFDSAFTVLAESPEPGVRRYIQDKSIRLALSHTLGDQKGMSETGVENRHATTLLGMTDLTGTDRTLQTLRGDAVAGCDIVLTLNAEMCAYMASQFPSGSRGACAVINYRTGAILGKVSLPGYDPAAMDQGAQDTAYYDRVLQYRYAPGSTYKIVTLTAALKNLPGVESEMFDCQGVWSFADRVLQCAGGTAHGSLDLKSAFSQSCNITFASLAYRMGAEAMKAASEDFGVNVQFAFDDIVLYESHCLNSSLAAGEVIQAGFGQGKTELTPLHMAMIAGAIANEGVMMEPKLIREVRRHAGGTVSSMQPAQWRTVTDADTARTVARYMYAAVHDRLSTGKNADISGYTAGYVCGKTGSAEVSSDKTKATNAWYVGFLYGDEEHPYAIAVVVEGGGSGGQTAAPIASRVLKKAIQMDLY